MRVRVKSSNVSFTNQLCHVKMSDMRLQPRDIVDALAKDLGDAIVAASKEIRNLRLRLKNHSDTDESPASLKEKLVATRTKKTKSVASYELLKLRNTFLAGASVAVLPSKAASSMSKIYGTVVSHRFRGNVVVKIDPVYLDLGIASNKSEGHDLIVVDPYSVMLVSSEEASRQVAKLRATAGEHQQMMVEMQHLEEKQREFEQHRQRLHDKVVLAGLTGDCDVQYTLVDRRSQGMRVMFAVHVDDL
jgi:hypothetical protein